MERFAAIAAARRAIAAWIAWYNAERLMGPLGYRSPGAFRALLARGVA